MSGAEAVATLLGLLGVGLMVRQHVWAWPVGIVQVILSGWVFWQSRLYSDVLLQVIFLVLQGYGWWTWTFGRTGAGEALPVTRLGARAGARLTVAGLVATAAWGEGMRRLTDAALPHADAFILVFSVLAQWLQARKRLESWLGWIAVNVVAVGVYGARGLLLFAGLYAVFLGLAVVGFRAWRRREVRR
ncbi:MAG: nicotinamide riboside transporter PnuC [Opitutaceae bacterium]